MSVDFRLLHEFVASGGEPPGNVQPELHLVGLTADQVAAVVAHLDRLGAEWDERPDVAALVARGEHVCVGADGITVDGTTLPCVSMFVYPDSIEFFWDAGRPWTERHVESFLALLAQILGLAPEAALRPDPSYREEQRRLLGRLIGDAVGRPDRIDLGEPASS